MRRPNVAPLLVLAVTFVLSRGWALWMGLRYPVDETQAFLQFLDLGVLRGHLARALWHLQSQPPLWNALIGVALKISPAHFGWLMLTLQLGLGLGAYLAIERTLESLGVPRLAAFGVALLAELNPAAILFEFDALYTSTVFALHCLLALAIVRFVRTRSRGALWALAGLCVAMTLVRSYLQWSWVALVFGLLLVACREDRRAIARAGGVALVLSLLWPLKNLCTMGEFTSSDWAGISLAKHWSVTPPGKAHALFAQGLLPGMDINPFVPAELKRLAQDLPPPARTGYPELDDLTKATGGAPNWNSNAILALDRQRMGQDVLLLRRDPGGYWTYVAYGLQKLLGPSSLYFLAPWQPAGVARNAARLAGPLQLAERLCGFGLGQRGPITQARQGTILYDALLFLRCPGIAVLLLLNACCAVSLVRGRRWQGAEPERRVLAVVMGTIVFCTLVTSLAEVGENMRFRYEIHGLLLMAATVFVQRGVVRARAGRGVLRG